MANPIIIQFDNEDFYFSVVDLILSSSGLALSNRAQGIAQSRALIQDIVSGKVKPDLAIVETMLENNNDEGRQLAKKLREIAPKIKIISYSVFPDVDWADYVAVKSNLDPEQTLIKGLESMLKLDLKTGDIDHS